MQTFILGATCVMSIFAVLISIGTAQLVQKYRKDLIKSTKELLENATTPLPRIIRKEANDLYN